MEVIILLHVRAFVRNTMVRQPSINAYSCSRYWLDMKQKTENWKLTLNYGDTIQTFICERVRNIDVYWLNRSVCHILNNCCRLKYERFDLLCGKAPPPLPLPLTSIDQFYCICIFCLFIGFFSSKTYLRFEQLDLSDTKEVRRRRTLWQMSTSAAVDTLRLLKSIGIDDDTFLQ